VLREVALLCALRHPNVVSCFGCAVVNGEEVVLAMEYVSGGSLQGLIEQFGVVPVAAVQRYLKDVLCGLCFLHEKSHRDVKPANVLLHIRTSALVFAL
jgi:serine/threonine protein kinase